MSEIPDNPSDSRVGPQSLAEVVRGARTFAAAFGERDVTTEEIWGAGGLEGIDPQEVIGTESRAVGQTGETPYDIAIQFHADPTRLTQELTDNDILQINLQVGQESIAGLVFVEANGNIWADMSHGMPPSAENPLSEEGRLLLESLGIDEQDLHTADLTIQFDEAKTARLASGLEQFAVNYPPTSGLENQ